MTGEDRADWTPQHPRQQPPFAKGNLIAMQHGAWSPAKVDPRAEDLVQRILGDESLVFLQAPSYRPALYAWARAEARVQLLDEYLGTDAVGDLESDRVKTAWTLLDKFSARAESARHRLGLDPVSRARLGKDVAQGRQADAAAIMAELRRMDRERGGGDES